MSLTGFLAKSFFIFFVFLIFCGFTLEIDYTPCKSIEDILNLEAHLILKCKKSDVENLTSLHISRGETYLLNNQIEDAIHDFSVAYMLVENIQDDKPVKFRLLFNEMIWHVALNNKHEVEVLGRHLISLFEEICSEKTSQYHCASPFNKTSVFLCNTTNIIGPDQEPYPGWCREVVLSTGVALAQLISTLPKNAAKIALGSVIAVLEQKALDCCLAGGLWKACVGPLAEKFNNWNQKWKVLRIPPDPAWD
jgi:hypothetical protein